MLPIVASNFQNIKYDLNLVQKYATTLMYIGTHFFSNSQKTLDLILKPVLSWFSRRKKHTSSKWEGFDNSTENLFGITDGYQSYEEYECEFEIVIGVSERTRKWKLQLEIVKTPIFKDQGFYNLHRSFSL